MAVVRFTRGGPGGTDEALPAALLRAITGAAGLAALLALLTGLAAARRITPAGGGADTGDPGNAAETAPSAQGSCAPLAIA
jgi:hypothetical protein